MATTSSLTNRLARYSNWLWLAAVLMAAGGAAGEQANHEAAAGLAAGEGEPPVWVDDPLVWDATPVDLSFLNHRPAGRHGRVVPRGDRFVLEQTGEPVRFWSCNLTGQACFGPEDETAAVRYLTTVADRIAALGFNHVRLHHIDNRPRSADGNEFNWWSGPSIVDYSGDSTLGLNPRGIDRIDRLIHLLKERGVYVYVDLFNLREFGRGEGIADYDAMVEVSPTKYCFNVDPEIRRSMVDFATLLGRHRNPHTGLRWADDPAICMAVLANENDFSFHTTRSLLGNSVYAEKVREQARVLRQAGLLAAPAPGEQDELTFGSPAFNRLAIAIEHHVYADMLAACRAAGWRAALSSGNWSYRGPVSVVGKSRSGDFTDNHAYQSETCHLLDDPFTTRSIFAKLGFAQVVDKPFVVSEWQTGRLAIPQMHLPHRASSVLASAAVAGHQGWDAISFFCYAQNHGQSERRGGGYEAYVDPAHMGVMPAAALLYRRDMVESPTPLVLELDSEETVDGRFDAWSTAQPGESRLPAAFLTGFEKHRIAFDFPSEGKDPPTDGLRVRRADLDRPLLPPGADEVTTDTGQSRRNWREGWQVIDTPRSQAAAGFIRGRALASRDIRFSSETEFAVIAVSSLTDRPLVSTERLLITALGRCDRLPGGGERYRAEVVHGVITLRVDDPDSRFRLTPMSGAGVAQQSLLLSPARQSAGRLPETPRDPDETFVTIDLARLGSPWAILERIPAEDLKLDE